MMEAKKTMISARRASMLILLIVLLQEFTKVSSQEDEQVGSMNEMCTVCIDGEAMSTPEKPLVLEGYPFEKCGDLTLITGLFPLDSDECAGIQSISTYCGCTSRVSDFTLCPNGEALPDPLRKISWFDDYSDIPASFEPLLDSLTCGLLEAIIQNSDGSVLNIPIGYLQFVGHLKAPGCGCEADWRANLYLSSFRISGCLSLVGSLLICLDILVAKRKRKSTYHQIVLMMSLYDTLSSLANIGNTAFAPEDSGLYHAAGTEGTCKLQGFMLQLGFTSVMCNAMLAVYFYLMVNRNWRERHFIRFRRWIYLGVGLLGLAMAVAGLWYYQSLVAICYVAQPPMSQSWLPLTFLFTIPMSITLVVGTASLIAVCYKVYANERKSKKWSASCDSRLSKRVFRQTFLYMMSLYSTVSLYLFTFYLRTEWAGHWIFHTVMAFLIPLQGFLNVFVYCKREHTIVSKTISYFQCKKNQATTLQQKGQGSADDRSINRAGSPAVRNAEPSTEMMKTVDSFRPPSSSAVQEFMARLNGVEDLEDDWHDDLVLGQESVDSGTIQQMPATDDSRGG